MKRSLLFVLTKRWELEPLLHLAIALQKTRSLRSRPRRSANSAAMRCEMSSRPLSPRLTALLLALFFFAIPSAKAAPAGRHFYLSPSGSDSNDGLTPKTAFATLDGARRRIRPVVGVNIDADVFVHIAAGDYYVSRPVVFEAADSGNADYTVHYVSDDGPGRARFIGGRRLSKWTQLSNNIWRTAILNDLADAGVHTLFQGNQRARRARHPNYRFQPAFRSARGDYVVTLWGTSKEELDGGAANRVIGYARNFEDAANELEWAPQPGDPFKMNVFQTGRADWHQVILDVTNVRHDLNAITFDLDSTAYVGAQARYFIEGNLSFLDAPGEFYYDRQHGFLYYMPYANQDPNMGTVVVPTTLDILRLEGNSRQESGLVRHLVFDGLELAISQAISPTREWWSYQYGRTDHGLIRMSDTHDVVIKNCHLKGGGRHGILIVGHNTYNRVEGNWIEQMGVSGITLSNRFANNAGGDKNEYNTLTNNKIHDVGQLSLYASAVSMLNVSHNEISYSEFFNLPRYGVTLRGNTNMTDGSYNSYNSFPPAYDNHFHHLNIDDCNQDSGDTGCVHAAGVSLDDTYPNLFEEITVTHSAAIAGMNDPQPPNGIFLDWPATVLGQTFRNIDIIDTQGWPLRVNGSDNPAAPANIFGSSFHNVTGLDNFIQGASFNANLMDYGHIGLLPEFPAAYRTMDDIRNYANWGTNWSWAANTRQVHVVDWDGDGQSDIFMQALGGNVSSQVFHNRGDRFERQGMTSFAGWGSNGSWAADTRTPHFMDVDADGDTDLFMQARSHTVSSQLFVNEVDAFERIDIISYMGFGSNGSWAADTRIAHVLDVNGDGKSDLLMQGRHSGVSSLLFLSGPSGYQRHDISNYAGFSSSSSWSADVRRVHSLDINGDGRDDLLMQGQHSGVSTQLFIANGGGFSRIPIINYTGFGTDASWAANVRQVNVLDINGDGRDDLFMQAFDGGVSSQLFVAGNHGGMNRTNIISYSGFGSNASWASDARRPVILDINGDGRSDLLMQARSNNVFSVLFTSTADGLRRSDMKTFAGWGTDTSWSSATRKVLALDIDGDGAAGLFMQSLDGRAESKLRF